MALVDLGENPSIVFSKVELISIIYLLIPNYGGRAKMRSIISKNKILSITLSLILLSSSISIPFQPNEAAAITFNPPQEIVNPNPSTSTEFGHSVTEVNDNLAVGVPKAQVGGFNNAGQVHIFNGATGSFDKTINPPTPAADLNFGASVSGIGNTDLIAVGVPGANSDDGQILIFDTTDGNLVLTINNPTVGAAEQMGRDQIDSINDNEFLVGVSLGDVVPGKTDAGKVYHFDRTIPAPHLVATYDAGPNSEANGFFGKSLSVFDSTRFIVGAYGSDDTGSGSLIDETGKAFAIAIPTGAVDNVFDNPNGLSTNTDDQFGWSVSSMTDRYVISAPGGDTTCDNCGMFAIYDGSFSILGQVGNDFFIPMEFGTWVDARNGLIVIGAPGLDFDKFFGPATDSGLVRVYDQDGTLIEDGDIFNPADPISEIPAGDRFGSSLVIIDRLGSTNLAVSAPFDSTEGTDGGVVWNITEDTGAGFVSAQLDITSDDPLGDDIVSQTQLVTYTYTLQNLGTETLLTTSVASVCSGGTPMTPNLPDPFLSGETRTFTCAAVPPIGSSHTEATTVTVSDGTNSFLCSDPEVTCNNLVLSISQPSMTLGGVAVPPTVPPGGTSIVTYTVTNTGNVDLNTSLSVDNPTECVISPTSQIISPGLSGTFSCTIAGISSDIIITGTATATDPPGDPVTSVPLSIPVTITVGDFSMTLDSVPEDNPVGPSGSTDVDFTVTNTGGLPLTDVTVTTDASSQGLKCIVTPPSIPSIPPGGTALFECTVSGITGDVTLTSTADSNETGPVTDDIEFKLATPNLTITNIVQDPNPGAPGEEVIISWSLENFGNIEVDDPTTDLFFDDMSQCFATGPDPLEDTDGDGKLDPSEVWNYACETSFPEVGIFPVTINAESQDKFSQEVSDSVTFDVIIGGTADLSIEKTGNLIPGGSSSGTIDVRISQSSDDAEEDHHEMDLDSKDLDMNEKEFVGLRFNNIDVPQGASITSAYVKFTVEDKKGDKGKAVVKIFGEDTDDATTFTSTNNDISDRTKTSSSVTWDIPNWKKEGDSGPAQTTPDLSSIIQEVVDGNGWMSGNSIALIIEEEKGKKDRDAKSYDKSPSESALLHIEFENGNSENELIYTIIINNNGPDDATNVNVIDNLPEEVVATSVEPTPECEIVDDVTVTCVCRL